jgi:hypothetical protein
MSRRKSSNHEKEKVVLRILKSSLFVFIVTISFFGCSDSADNPVSSNNITSLEGFWAGGCTPFIEGGFTGSSDWVEGYDGSDYQALFSVYSTTDCTGIYQAQKEMTGTFVIGDSLMTSSGVTAQNIDLTISQSSIDGQIAGVDISQFGFEAGQIWYDIFYINGGNLYYGDSNTGDSSSPLSRPADISFDFVYTKQ